MSGQQATITRADTTGARYSTVRMLVPWSQGEQTSIATIRSTRAVQVGATTYPTRWRVRGAPHNDGSIRFTYAEWFMEVANGNLSSGAPTHTATVVAAANNPGAASFAAWADQLNITLAYTSETGSSVSVDIAARARAGTDGSIYTVSDEGGTRFITYETWIGPGRRHEPRRSAYATYRNTRGPSAGNNVVQRQGLLHVVCKIEVRDQDDHIIVELNLRNDAAYPYPSAPNDGGERAPGRPARPTLLIHTATDNPFTPGVSEQLESPLFRRFQSGITLTISHPTTTVYSCPFAVSNRTTGVGPLGTIPTTGNGTISIPIRGLADGQCWGRRFAVSDVSIAEATFWASHACNGWIAVPTYATWLATERSRTLVGGEVNGDTITRLGWDFALYEGITSQKLTDWRLRGHTPSAVRFMNQTLASPWGVGWKSVRGSGINGGGKHFGVGFLHEGEAMLAGSPEFLYRTGCYALQEASCRPFQFESDALETMDLLTDTGGSDNYTVYIWGTGDSPNSLRGVHPTSVIQFGRAERGDLGTHDLVAWYNGAPAVRTNPDPEQDLEHSGPNWYPMKATHMAIRPLFIHALLTDSAMDRYLLRQWANLASLNFPQQTFNFALGPNQLSIRGESRPQWLAWHGFVLSDDATWRSRIQNHICLRIASWVNPSSRSWWDPIGFSLTPGFFGGPCGNSTSSNVDDMIQWWLAAPACENAGNWMIDAPTDALAREIGRGIMYLTRHTVDFGFWANPTQLSAEAQRNFPAGFDSCFASRAASPSIDTYPVAGLIVPAGSRVDRAASSGTTLVMQNIHDRANTRNHAQNSQQWAALPLSLVFAANRARAGHTDRVRFIRQAMIATFPELGSGDVHSDDEDQHLGFMSGDSYRPATQGPGPSATFTVSTRTGIIPLAVTLDPAASVINGNTAVATYRWWDHYIVGATPSATGTGVPSTRVVTYNGPGLFRPALEITQEDNQVSLYVDGPGIDARPAIIPAPNPSFSASPSVLTAGEGDTVQFSYVELGGRATTYVWEYRTETGPGAWTAFGNGARDPIWPDPAVAGSYSFRVTATNATGSATRTESNLVRVSPPTPPPTASFAPSVTNGLVPLSVDFDGSSTTFSGAAASVEWKWWKNYDPSTAADSTVTGTSGSSYSPTYSVPGTFYPGLQVTQADGKRHVFVYTPGIVVQAIPSTRPPAPDFTVSATTVTAGDPLTFTYIDGPSGGRALSYVWSYKLATSDTWINFSTERSPQWTSPDVPGIYDFRVIATNEASETGTKERLGLVIVTAALPAPVPTFTATPSYGGLATEIAFDAAASTYSGLASATQWEWFQDASEEVPTVTYDGIGGNEWTYTYTSAGTYYPALRLTQEDGQFAMFVYSPGIVISQTPISDPPTPDFTASPTTITSGGTVQFTYIERGTRALTYVWEYRIESPGPGAWTAFGSGAVNPTWTAPATTGLYSIRVTATNEFGSTTKTRTSLVTVNPATPAPQATFTPDATTGAAPLQVDFDASASVLGGTLSAATWNWYANSNQGSPTQSIVGTSGSTWTHTYNSAGTYYPMLVLEQSDGQTSVFIYTPGIIVEVVPLESPPFPRFRGSPIQVDAGSDVLFTYVEGGGRALTYSWEYRLGSGAWTEFATTRNAAWEAPEVQGVYDIRVTATNEHGSNTRTRTRYITVRSAAPEATFTPDVTSGQYPLEVVFDASASVVHGNASVATWDWYADSGDEEPTETITGTSGDEWTHEYALPGLFTPMLVLTQEDEQESRYIYAPGIVVTTDPNNDPPEGTITIDDATAEPGQNLVVTWNDAGVLATSHVWYYSEAGESDWIEFSRLNPAALEAPATAGSYDVRCEATNQNGTTTVDEPDLFTVSSGSAPTASFTLSKNRFDRNDPLYPQPFCTVTDESTGADSWTWRIDPVGSIFYGQAPPAFQLPGKGTHRITLTVANAYGTSSVTKLVTVTTGRERTVVHDPTGTKNRIEREGV